MTKNVFVTGGTGFVGSHLIDHLISDGFTVSALVRKSSNLKWLQDKPISLIYGDLNKPKSYEKYLNDIDYVCHVGGIVRAKREKEFFSINVEGTRNLIEAVKQYSKSLKKFIFISSLEAGGPSKKDHIRTENDQDSPITAYGKSKKYAEDIILSNTDAINSIIFRPPIIYGPRDIGLYEFFKSIKKGIVLNIGFKEQFASCIYIDDLIEYINHAIEIAIPSGTIFYISDQNTPYSILELQNKIKKIIKRKNSIQINIPKPVFFILCLFGHILQNILNKLFWLNLTRYKTLSQKNWSCSSKLINQIIKIENNTSLKLGLNKTYNWYLKNKWL